MLIYNDSAICLFFSKPIQVTGEDDGDGAVVDSGILAPAVGASVDEQARQLVQRTLQPTPNVTLRTGGARPVSDFSKRHYWSMVCFY